ncbi:MAG: DUF2141 domain-containing protein [Candidatus Cloacimonetes bacterium]|nr:DUF2141 domain-containing protein [Candidatus Cloacimonadota bacterium]
MRYRLILLALAMTATVWAQATLTIEVSGVRSDDGMVMMSLLSGEDSFKNGQGEAFFQAHAAIENGRVVFVIEDVPPGVYAIRVMHDENGNGKMDTNWIGIPKEGYGASNNPKPRMGPPRWKDCHFEVTGDDLALGITMRY